MITVKARKWSKIKYQLSDILPYWINLMPVIS